MKTIQKNVVDFLAELNGLDVKVWLENDQVRVNAPKGVMTPARLAEFKTYKTEIMDWLQQRQTNQAQQLIHPAARNHRLPLSYAQQRLWFLAELGSHAAYNMPAVLEIVGKLDLLALQQTLSEIVRRHESLRTTFGNDEGTPYQTIQPPLPVALPVVDLQTLTGESQQAEAKRLCQREALKAFDLQHDLMVRAQLLQLAGERFLLLLTMHHIASDGWSIGVLVQEIATLYAAFSQGQPSPLPELAIQYADFAHWQRDYLQGEVLERQFSYWLQQLAGAPHLLQLPTDYPRPAQQSFAGAAVQLTIDAPLTQALRHLSQRAGTTLYMTLLAAFQILIARHSGQQDVVVGSPIANRHRQELEPLIGFFVNTLALRCDLSDNPNFLTLLAQVKATTQAAYDHQDLPFERLVEALAPERDLTHNPLVQVIFALQNAPMEAFELPGLQVKMAEFEVQSTRVDLEIHCWEVADGLQLYALYSSDLFQPTTIQRLLGHFQTLLTGIVTNPSQSVATLPMLTQDERHKLLVEWNDTATDYPKDKCIHHLFEEQVERTPDAVALVFEEEQLTYRQLNERANQVAHSLQSLGVGPEVLVGICVERSIDMVVGLLAILKAGGVYVPIDPSYPQERIAFMLQDTATPILLTQSHLVAQLPTTTAQIICLDLTGSLFAQQDNQNALIAETHCTDLATNLATNLAYVMYTSGSTGQPKGTSVTHRNVVRLVKETNFMHMSSDEVFLQLASISFDATTLELWAPLLNGGKLILLPPHQPSLNEIAEAIQQHQVTSLWLTAGLFHLMVDEQLDALRPLRQLLAGGDVLSPHHVQRVRQTMPTCRLINGYGPTENTTFTCCYSVSARWTSDVPVPIGRPIANTQVYILDNHLQPVPIGVAGELYAGGDGVAVGYYHRPELTTEKFIENPFGEGRLYRTGDLCRWLPDGNIEFLGRIDQQVKIRGFRIELGEIEAVLSQHPAVQETVVIAREDEPGEKRLVAYVVPDKETKRGGDKEPDDDAHAPAIPRFWAALRTYLQHKLPDYMIPNAFVPLDALPLTPNGKLDRKALPAPDYGEAQREFVAPRTSLESQLAVIWQAVLGIERVGVYDNFFALGGHSLLATQVISRIRTQLQCEVPLKWLFEAPQIAAFAQRLSEQEASLRSHNRPLVQALVRSGELPYRFPLSFAQQRLWFLDQLETNSGFYNIPMQLHLSGALDIAALAASFHYLQARHESLRTRFETVDGEAVQVIDSPSAITLAVQPVASAAAADALAGREAVLPFNLHRGPLWRVHLLRVAEREHRLLLTLHHSISDGWSNGLLVKELSQAYRSYLLGEQPSLPPLPIQYADFAVWQRSYLSGETLDRHLGYWQAHLRDAPALLELPTDRPRPPVQSHRGAHHAFQLSAELTRQLQQLAQAHDATLFMVLLAAFNVLLARYSRQTDLVVGSPIANRNQAEIEGLIGFFVNTLVLRTQLDDNPSFHALLERVRQTTLAAYEHQDLPFEQLVEALQPERSLSYSPLFQVMFVLQNADLGEWSLPNLTARMALADFPFAKFDLTLNLVESDAGLLGMLEYNSDLFDESTIVRMAGYFAVLLEGIVNQPAQPVLHLPMLTEAEYQQIVYEWNDTAVDFGPAQTIHALFEQQVARTPDAVAVVMGIRNEELGMAKETSTIPNSSFLIPNSLTYAELNARANQLAHHLQDLGVGPDVVVGLLAMRGLDFLIAMLAIFKAGGAYLPLEPRNPIARHVQILQQSRCPLILCAESFVTELREGLSVVTTGSAHYLPTLLSLEELLAQEASRQNLFVNAQPNHLAYVIFTSGSTGLPKGAMVEQRGMVNHLFAKIKDLNLDATDRVAQTASQAFDISVWQFLAALVVGGSIYIYPDDISLNPDSLLDYVENDRITIWETVPSLMRALLDSLQPAQPLALQSGTQPPVKKSFLLVALRWLIPTGEALPPTLVNQWLALYPRIPLLNAYGPTECSDDVTHYPINQPFPATVVNAPIGYPIGNMRAYILDSTLQPLPIGVPGELWIGGVGVGRGYLHDPERTAAAFIPDPFINDPTARLYKTGDFCRWLPSGNPSTLQQAQDSAGSGHYIEYLGRTDFQVKIRGFRIELGEIENALLAQEGVREAVVVAREERAGDKRLVAYVVLRDAGNSSHILALRSALQAKLPEYMMPSAFVLLEAMPLTPNGKLDRKALPAPEYGVATKQLVPAQTLDETRLVLLWQAVLGVQPIGVEDNFFALGGHSLLATQLVQRMRETLQRPVSLQQLFQTPTIRTLLQGMTEMKSALNAFVPLRKVEQQGNLSQAPLFLLPPAGGMALPYTTLLPYLAATQPVYAYQARGIYDDLPPFARIEEMATTVRQEMKQIQPQGPYRLGGWSFGGMVAFAVACQLRQQGEQVEFLGVMDAYPPTDAPAAVAEELSTQAEVEGFFYLLGDIMGVDYHRLDAELFADATQQAEPVAWLLDQLNERGIPLALEPTLIKRIWTTMKQNSRLMQAYQPPCYDGAITLFCAEASAPADGAERWQTLTPQPVDTVWVKGEHNTMLNASLVEKLGRELAKRLQTVNGG